MNKEEGLKQIDDAKWEKDAFGCLNLHVTHEKGTDIHCYLSLRPVYCDRGHIQFFMDGAGLFLDAADSFPRFFFSFKEADTHVREFLKWRLWKYRTHPHTLDVVNTGKVCRSTNK